MVRSFFFFSSRRRHTRLVSDWSSDVCSSDLVREEILSPLGRNAKCKRKKKHGWSNKVTDLFYGQTAVMDDRSPAPDRKSVEKGKSERISSLNSMKKRKVKEEKETWVEQ